LQEWDGPEFLGWVYGTSPGSKISIEYWWNDSHYSNAPFILLMSSYHFNFNCYPHEAKWTLFQTHYFSENLVASGIDPRTSGFVARNSNH
jgi:hypothetical protein